MEWNTGWIQVPHFISYPALGKKLSFLELSLFIHTMRILYFYPLAN